MANPYYDHTTYPANGATGSSSAMRSELDAIEAGFDKLPTLSGNSGKIVAVNTGETALEAVASTGTGNIVRSASPTLTGTLTVTGNVAASGTLAAGNTTITGTLSTSGTATLNALSCTNNATVGGTLGVTGASTLASLSVTGAATVGTTLGVTGATTLSSLSVTGAATVGTTLGVTGATTLSSTLAVTGNTTLSGTLDVDDGTTITNTLNVTGAVDFDSTLIVGGAATFSSTLAAGNTTITGTLGVTGAVDFDSTLNVDGTLNVEGATTVDDTLAVTGATTISPTFNASTATLSLAGLTGNWIGWSGTGLAAPAFTTRSAGTKLVLFPSITGAALDYAIGVETGSMWFSTNTTAAGFKWYAGATTEMASLTSGIFVATAYRATGIGSTHGIGYTTGAGGTVTQATSKSTSVTLNAMCGEITMHNAALAADTTVSFNMVNSSIAASDILILNHVSGGTLGSYTLNANCGSGTVQINVRNVTGGSLSEALVLGFAVIKAVTS